MIAVTVDQLFLSNMGFVVLLKGDDRSLPIFIGAAEAQAIAIQVNRVEMPRPLTHDLLKNVLDFMECRMMRIEVCDLRDETFYARLVLEHDGGEMSIDSRPSDAIALALRFGAPIFVAEDVMDRAGRVLDKLQKEAQEGAEQGDAAQAGEEHDTTLPPLEALKKRLEIAVRAERYEDAARIRDEIKRLEDPNSGN